jgi:hypothetical protein
VTTRRSTGPGASARRDATASVSAATWASVGGLVDDHQQVDVAAARDVVAEGQRAVQNHLGNGLPERM